MAEHRFIPHALGLMLHPFNHCRMEGTVINNQPIPPEYDKPDFLYPFFCPVAQFFCNF